MRSIKNVFKSVSVVLILSSVQSMAIAGSLRVGPGSGGGNGGNGFMIEVIASEYPHFTREQVLEKAFQGNMPEDAYLLADVVVDAAISYINEKRAVLSSQYSELGLYEKENVEARYQSQVLQLDTLQTELGLIRFKNSNSGKPDRLASLKMSQIPNNNFQNVNRLLEQRQQLAQDLERAKSENMFYRNSLEVQALQKELNESLSFYGEKLLADITGSSAFRILYP